MCIFSHFSSFPPCFRPCGFFSHLSNCCWHSIGLDAGCRGSFAAFLASDSCWGQLAQAFPSLTYFCCETLLLPVLRTEDKTACLHACRVIETRSVKAGWVFVESRGPSRWRDVVVSPSSCSLEISCTLLWPQLQSIIFSELRDCWCLVPGLLICHKMWTLTREDQPFISEISHWCRLKLSHCFMAFIWILNFLEILCSFTF